jgi:hypothetical protein
MISLVDYKDLFEVANRYNRLLNENVAYDGFVFNKTPRSNAEKEKLLKEYHRDFARTVFSTYCKQNPTLLKRPNADKVKFKSEFGDSFDEISETKKIWLVCLITGGGGKVRFTEEVVWPNGTVVPPTGPNYYISSK